ncbi:MAG: S9 family peptidase [Bacteroidota bacterium]|nr:S9 family peptidase [Bacteroidota bacterium]
MKRTVARFLPPSSILFIACCLLFTGNYSLSQPKPQAPMGQGGRHAITFDDLFGFGRVTDPQISPDGKWIAYTVAYFSKETNGGNSDIWLVSINGGQARQLTDSPKSDGSPRWLPDGRTIAFISSRNGAPQIFTMQIDSNGTAIGDAKQITNISTGASGLVVSPDGKYFAFSSEVFPACPNDSCNKARNDELENGNVKAKIFTHLPYRVWNHYLDGKRSHAFIVPASGGTSIDATPSDYDTPPIDLGGTVDYGFSPDGKEFAFVRNTDPVIAISTNNDIYLLPLNAGKPSGEPTCITAMNKANDNQPIYSPDGIYIAYRATKRPGFESDKSSLTLYERSTGKIIPLTEKLDRSVSEVVWSPDSKALYFNTDDEGYRSLYKVSLTSNGTVIKQMTRNMNCGSLCITPDGKTLVFGKQSVTHPTELWRMETDGKNLKQLTTTNDARIANIEWNPLEPFWFSGAGGTRVEGFLLKPPFFDAKKKYPMVLLIHGGPQGQWEDETHYRWNAQMFASPGYVVVMINPRGSTGYGQKFTDEISGDWGGKVFTDLMNGVHYALKTFPFIDKNRVAAAGASYGGYMINWIEGHNDDGLFKALVCHDGMFNAVSAYGSTEELWFNEWEFKGTPWTNPKLYERFSPSSYVEHFKTPMLIIHSQHDYRLDVSEGFQMFTALQRMHVPSKMLYFPDEFHFVVKPLNSELWHKTVLGWLAKYLK